MTVIRPENSIDISVIRAVNAAAFGQEDEGMIVDKLRDADALRVSLVVVVDGDVVGHIAFSPVRLVGEGGETAALGLGPMAVHPDFQKQGLGGELIAAGVEACKALDEALIFVLGHPDYYPRFGFRPTYPFNIAWEIDCPKEAFMVLELKPGALSGLSGKIKYHPAFMGG